MLMSWQLLAAVNVLSITSYGLSQRWALRDGKYNPDSFAIAMVYGAGLTSLLVAIVSGTLDLNYADLPLHIAAISLVFNAFQLPIISRALALTQASVFTILANLRVIPIIILAALFLDDEITLQIVIGAAVVLLGTSLVLYEKGTKFHLKKGEIYSLLAGLFIAVPFISDSYALRDGYDPASYLAFIWIIPATTLAILRPQNRREMVSYLSDRQFLYKAAIPGASLSVAVISIMTAFQLEGNPSVLTVISQLSSVTVVLFAILFLNERDSLSRKLAASVIAFVGLLIVNL